MIRYTDAAYKSFDKAWVDRNKPDLFENSINYGDMESVLIVRDRMSGFELIDKMYPQSGQSAYVWHQQDADIILEAEKSREQTMWWITMSQIAKSPVNVYPVVLPGKKFRPVNKTLVNETVPFGNCGSYNKDPQCTLPLTVLHSARRPELPVARISVWKQKNEVPQGDGGLAGIEMWVAPETSEPISLGMFGSRVHEADTFELDVSRRERIVRTEMWANTPNDRFKTAGSVFTELYAMRLTTNLNRTWTTSYRTPAPAADAKAHYDFDLRNTPGEAWACGLSAREAYTKNLKVTFATAMGFDWCYHVAATECSGSEEECDVHACPKIEGLEPGAHRFRNCVSK